MTTVLLEKMSILLEGVRNAWPFLHIISLLQWKWKGKWQDKWKYCKKECDFGLCFFSPEYVIQRVLVLLPYHFVERENFVFLFLFPSSSIPSTDPPKLTGVWDSFQFRMGCKIDKKGNECGNYRKDMNIEKDEKSKNGRKVNSEHFLLDEGQEFLASSIGCITTL